MRNILPTTLIFNSHNLPVQPLITQGLQVIDIECNLLLLYLCNTDPNELITWDTISWLNSLFQVSVKYSCPFLAVHSFNKFQNICSIIKKHNVLNVVLYSITLQEIEPVLKLFSGINFHIIYPDGTIRTR